MELAHRIAVMRTGQVAQVGRAARDLHGAGEPVRRELRRLVERARGYASARFDGGVAVVETDLGAVEAVAAEGVAAGGDAVALCRPERTRLARAEPDSAEPLARRGPRGRVPRRQHRARRSRSASTPSASGAWTRAMLEAGTEGGCTWSRSTSACCRRERLRPARPGDVHELPRGVRRAPAALPGRAQRRVQRLLGPDALRGRRRGGERSRDVHDHGAERRAEARVHRPSAAAPSRPTRAHAVPDGAQPVLHRREDARASSRGSARSSPACSSRWSAQARSTSARLTPTGCRATSSPSSSTSRRSSACGSATPRASSTSPSRTSSTRRSSARASSSTTSRARSSPRARPSRGTPRTIRRRACWRPGCPRTSCSGRSASSSSSG